MRRFILILALSLPATALAAFGDTKERLENVEAEADALDRRLEAVERVVANQSLLEIMRRMDALQSELNQIRGEVEELRHEVDSARQRQRDLYLDLDRRLRALELGGTVATPTATQPSAGSATSDEPEPAMAKPTTSGERPRPEVDDRTAYQAAFEILKEGRFVEAREAYAGFLADYPDSPLGDNAQYWFGETFYVMQEHQRAIQEFRKVLDEHQGSDKSPDALLKIGFSQYELERWDDARATLQSLVQQLQGKQGAETYVDLAQRRLERMTREGH